MTNSDLVLEDDESVREAVTLVLEAAQFEVLTAEDGAAALDVPERDPFDLVILDLMLPTLDGFEVCRSIRRRSTVPIVILTARADTGDVVRGLELGADDYLTKPFVPAELAARARAAVRRTVESVPPRWQARDLEIDEEGFTVRRAGEELALSATETRLLVALASRPGQVLSREALLDRVWARSHPSRCDALRSCRRCARPVSKCVHGIALHRSSSAWEAPLLLLFLDDDVLVAPSYLADLVALARSRPDVAVFGGPNLTPAGASRRSVIQGRLLADRWLTGPMSARYRPLSRERPTRGSGLTLCNLAVRAAAAPVLPSGQRGGEENVMLTDLRGRGHRMVLHPALTVEHERRTTVVGFARQIHKYGFGRGEALVTTGPMGAVVVGGCVVAAARWPRTTTRLGAVGAAAVAAAAWRASPDDEHRLEDLAQAGSLPLGYLAGVVHGVAAALVALLSGRAGRASRG